AVAANRTTQDLVTTSHGPPSTKQLETDLKVDIKRLSTAPIDEIEDVLKKMIGETGVLTEAIDRRTFVIGRIILTVAKRKLFRPHYKNITEYIHKHIMGDLMCSHGTAFDSYRINKRFPSWSIEEYERYGVSNMLAAADRFDESYPQGKKLLNES